MCEKQFARLTSSQQLTAPLPYQQGVYGAYVCQVSSSSVQLHGPSSGHPVFQPSSNVSPFNRPCQPTSPLIYHYLHTLCCVCSPLPFRMPKCLALRKSKVVASTRSRRTKTEDEPTDKGCRYKTIAGCAYCSNADHQKQVETYIPNLALTYVELCAEVKEENSATLLSHLNAFRQTAIETLSIKMDRVRMARVQELAEQAAAMDLEEGVSNDPTSYGSQMSMEYGGAIGDGLTPLPSNYEGATD